MTTLTKIPISRIFKYLDIQPLKIRRIPICAMNGHQSQRNSSSTTDNPNNLKKSILLSNISKHVAHLQISNKRTKNSFTVQAADELVQSLELLEKDEAVRCIILSGDGPDFTSGIDLNSFTNFYQKVYDIKDQARKSKYIKKMIEQMQKPFKIMDQHVSKPIITCIHGLCFGLGMELAACSDIRFCSQDAHMTIREVRIGMAADVGSLQKLPKLFSNQSLLREYIFTGDKIPVDIALSCGFVGRVFKDKDETLKKAIELAEQISANSPVAVQTSKVNIKYSENKSFEDGLDYNAIWNMSMLQSEDFLNAIASVMTKSKADFENY